MKRCAVCNSVVFYSSLKSNGQSFCSTYCMTYSEMPGFCDRCVQETTDDPAPSTTLSTLGGSTMFGASDRCGTCHSIVRRHMYLAVMIPIWWKARYRIIYVDQTRYVGRRLRDDATLSLPPRAPRS